MTQESIANQPISAEGKEKIFSPEKTAERLYQLGFRLSAPLETPLTDTGNEIVLSNVYAPFYLTKTWADGVDRRVEQFYQFLGITEDEEIADWLWQKSSEKREPDPAGKEELAKFLIEKQPRQAWGELNCYLALAESGSQPWQWIPEEMVVQVAAKIKERPLRGLFLDKEVVGWILPQPEIAKNAVFKILTEPLFPYKEETAEVVRLVKEFAGQYPNQTDEIVQEIEKDPLIRFTSFTYLLGPEIIKRLAEKRCPNWEADYAQWVEHEVIIHHADFMVQDDGSLRSRDGKMVIQPPRPTFVDVYGRVEFQTPEAIAKDLADTEDRISNTKRELERLKQRRGMLESLTK